MPKKSIPKTLKIAIWNKYIGENIGKHKCLCCNLSDITQMKFHAGHIISEKNGGTLNIDNLIPICESCNKSMGTKNMDDFKKMLFSNALKNIIDIEYSYIVKYIEDLYVQLGIKIKDKFECCIHKISGNKQTDINLKFLNKISTDGINGKLMDISDFGISIKNSIYEIGNMNKDVFLNLVYKHYIT